MQSNNAPHSLLRSLVAAIKYGFLTVRVAASNAHAIWCMDDPLPAAAEFFQSVGRLWQERQAVAANSCPAVGDDRSPASHRVPLET